MKGKKKPIQQICYILILLVVIVILFNWYTTQNSMRLEEQNRNYAADSARLTTARIDEELENALNLINTYAYFLEGSLKEPVISESVLGEMERNSLFDAMLFTDTNGKDYSSDGRTADSSERRFYMNGMEGKSGTSILYNSHFFNETTANFYVPVRYNGEIIGVLRGVFLAEKYLKDMLTTTYFGEEANVYLCMPDGRVIASSNGMEYAENNLIDVLVENNVIDVDTSDNVRAVFENGGEGSFICDNKSKTDNICVMYLPKRGYVLVQTFPKSVTQKMIRDENIVGIQLETTLIILFAIYIVTILIRSRWEKKKLEQENREMGYIIDGVNTLFSRFAMADFEEDTYQYLIGTRPPDSGLAVSGEYEDLRKYLSSLMINESDREEFAAKITKDAIIESLDKHSDLRFECYVMREGRPEWEHVNIICVERNNGKTSKVLFVRQNITEIKEKELSIQAEMSLAYRKERQYRIAVSANAICNYEFNLTKDIIESDVVRVKDGKQSSMLEKVGMEAPCKASEWFERWKQFVLEESMEEYSTVVNLNYLKEHFEQGKLEVVAEYWSDDTYGDVICVRQSYLMTRDDDTDDIMVMVITKDITDIVRKQKEETQALQDALMQAQHANRAKTTFLSNMSHDIRTPMNAIIGFTNIALNHIDNKEQVKDSLQKVLSSSNHLLSLINDILDMSRIESGKLQIKEQECNLSEMMHNMVNIIQPQVKAKQLELFIDTFEVVNEDVITDPLKLNQVFINLLSNAVKYTPAGGEISFRIMQKSTFRHGYADYVFIIKDNGIGMSQEFVEHIFEPFERETTVTQSGIQGTGLGMAITKNIVEMMNGTISVESERGKGSTFTVEFTLKLQDNEKTEEQIKELGGLRALVVDDDFNVCDSVNKMLKEIGMRSEWTTSGKEAVYRAKLAYEEGDAFHTYIIDWQMPEVSGVETARRIRSMVKQDVPVIIMTAYDWSDIEEEAKEAGVTAFCAKPMFMSDLRSALLASNNISGKEEETTWSKIDFGGKRILLVEDIELNREIAEVILEESGFKVESAPDGTDAVAMVRQSEEYYYDAILMDVQMPIMNGYEATRTIRALPRKDVNTLPIIAMTANALEEDKEAALKNGMNAHIAKPIDVDVFMEVLGQFLG
ncbi:MAG: response regulator [Lachnospiraceae bacterium]|nr:response regulator [Lachnospiraceae bacterium]